MLVFSWDNAQLEIQIIEEQTLGAVPLKGVAVSCSLADNSTRVLKYEYIRICSQEEWRLVTMEVVSNSSNFSLGPGSDSSSRYNVDTSAVTYNCNGLM